MSNQHLVDLASRAVAGESFARAERQLFELHMAQVARQARRQRWIILWLAVVSGALLGIFVGWGCA